MLFNEMHLYFVFTVISVLLNWNGKHRHILYKTLARRLRETVVAEFLLFIIDCVHHQLNRSMYKMMRLTHMKSHEPRNVLIHEPF